MDRENITMRTITLRRCGAAEISCPVVVTDMEGACGQTGKIVTCYTMG
jgi:hypothetical protein